MLNSSDIRHNQNCYSYLRELAKFINDTNSSILPELKLIKELGAQDYDSLKSLRHPLFFHLTYLEEQIDLIYQKLSEDQKNSVDDLILCYHSHNHILEDTEWFKEVNTQIRPQNSAGNLISYHLKDSSPVINKQSPKKAESAFSRFATLFTPNFKPQMDTNVPSIKNHSYQSDINVQEYRFSTQGQRHNGQVRVSPLFTRIGEINAAKYPTEKPINHIYFNNLGLDRGGFDNIPGTNEKEMSNALHQLEQDASLKIAVITLPASKGHGS